MLLSRLLKNIAIFSLLFAFVMQVFSTATIYASFLAQQDYIAKYLCIDKDIPESNCNGTCKLSQELKKEREQKEDPVAPVYQELEVQFCSCEKMEIKPIFSVVKKAKHPSFHAPVSNAYLNSIFKPPRV